MKRKVAGFELPLLPSEDRLQSVLRASLRKHLPKTLAQPQRQPFEYWDSSFYGLTKIPRFQKMDSTRQRQVLEECAQGLLEEAYFVEKAGIGYAAKMVLQSETLEERQIYGMIGGEEATHLAQISPYLAKSPPVGTDDPFLRFLSDLIEDAPKSVLLLVVQVVLEGWGLTHYRSLASGCLDPGLKAVLDGIVLDEARHHGSGVILFESRALSVPEIELAVETLEGFLSMVRVGPQRVVAALNRASGGLNRRELVTLFEELETESHSAKRLQTLKDLLKSETAEPIMAQLIKRGAFEPMPPESCVL